MPVFEMKRLDFRLHEFTRYTWVSDQARDVWQPRIRAIIKAWSEIEVLAALAKIRPCLLRMVSPVDLIPLAAEMAARDLAVMPLSMHGVSDASYQARAIEYQPGKPFIYRVVIGKTENGLAFKQATEQGDQTQISRLLGSPACCQNFFQRVWVEERFIDTTWPMAVNTPPAGHVSPLKTHPTMCEIQGPPQANILLRWLGVRAVPHLPCRFDCEATVELAEQFLALGQQAGYSVEMDWLLEMLSWPVEWSALHGIAEIKTPVLKITTCSDATPEKYVVRCQGSVYPTEGAQGLTFPYQQPTRLKITRSKSLKRRLEKPIKLLPSQSSADKVKVIPVRLEETILNQLMTFHEAHFDELNIAAICSGDYFTTVKLTDGRQGAAINLNNTHGPHRITYNYVEYDNRLLDKSKTDPLLRHTILSQANLDSLGQSVKIAIFNALSVKLIAANRLQEHKLQLAEGVLDIVARLKEGDVVGMIGCMGNYACLEVGRTPFLRQIYFSDFEYVEPFKADVEAFIGRAFQYIDKVIISDGSDNKAICERSDVVIITAGTLCTNTLDDLLQWAKGSREILVVGRTYAMDPVPLFAKGITGLTTQRIVQPNIVTFVKNKLNTHEVGFTDSLTTCFKLMHVVKSETIRRDDDDVENPKPRTNKINRDIPERQTILAETLQYLEATYTMAAQKIRTIQLGHYFTVIALNDGSVGACMSTYRLGPAILAQIQKQLEARLTGDPLLIGLLLGREQVGPDALLPEGMAGRSARKQGLLLAASLRATLLNALSAPWLSNGGDATVSASAAYPADPFVGAERALVVGFGGYMDQLIRRPHTTNLHIADLTYKSRQKEMERTLSQYRQQFPEKTITISDGHDTAHRLKEVDLVSISGSTLCNGTLDDLLDQAKAVSRIIVQGQSACIHPKVLFERGVDLVVTTLKPPELVPLAQADLSGKYLRPLLEGGLPPLYLWPRQVKRPPTAPNKGRSAREAWFDPFTSFFRENGYRSAPQAIYEAFLPLIDRPGKILALGCGNGLLLRYLSENSGQILEPFGVDLNAQAIQHAQTVIWPTHKDAFTVGDVRSHDFLGGPFSFILANPFYADRGYYEQVNGKIRRFHGDGSMSRYLQRCFEHLAPGGRLILWCYSGQLREIHPWRQRFNQELSVVNVHERAPASGVVRFWIGTNP